MPVVIKPIDSNSSKGITKINNFNFLDEGIELAKKYSKQKNIIIEEYIKGREFSVDGYIINKNFHLLCISELKKKTVKELRIQPSDIPNLIPKPSFPKKSVM